MNSVVIVSGEQQRDLAIHMHVSILPQTPLPSRWPHTQCNSRSLLIIHFKYSSVYMSTPNSPAALHPSNHKFGTVSLLKFSVLLNLFLCAVVILNISVTTLPVRSCDLLPCHDFSSRFMAEMKISLVSADSEIRIFFFNFFIVDEKHTWIICICWGKGSIDDCSPHSIPWRICAKN